MRLKCRSSSWLIPFLCFSVAAGGLRAGGTGKPGPARAEADEASPPIATIEVHAQPLGARIPKDFLGFSNEVDSGGASLPTTKSLGAFERPSDIPADAKLVYVLGMPDVPNFDFFHLMRKLGPGLLRIGGNSEDLTCWDPQHAPLPSWCHGVITPELLKLYGTAAKAAGWKLILGLNVKGDSPVWAVREVSDGVAKEIPEREILALELGNEPDLYARDGARTKPYPPASYAKEALAYAQALHADPATRALRLTAPATCCGWNEPRALVTILDAIGSRLSLVTIHNYASTNCKGRIVTAAELLSPGGMVRFNRVYGSLAAVARAHGLPIVMGETNSASCGGMAGVSDAFASAAWGLDYLFNVARDGYARIAFHFSYRAGGSAYNPILTYGWKTAIGREHYRNVAQPLYYAMYLFTRFAAGEQFLPATIDARAHISAFATAACVQCAVHVIAINEDSTAAGIVRVHLPGRAKKARLLLLDAPSLASMAQDVRYGGRQFDTRGRIGAPSTTPVARDAQGNYTFTLPNAAIAVLTVSR